jgi:hypothetical protein
MMTTFVVSLVATPSMPHALIHGSQAVGHAAHFAKPIIMYQNLVGKVMMEALIPIV